MTSLGNRTSWLALVVMVIPATVSTAHAQSCGDPDGIGGVAVTDGVNVLRHTASLSSTCTADPTRCDADGNGNVTVTDGVNVLRSAAGLTATLVCPLSANDVARFAGRYEGTFSGDDRGIFDVDADCDGSIEGFGSGLDEDFDVFGRVVADGGVTLTAGDVTTGATFRGTIGNDGRVSGTWSNRLDGSDGTFQGSRTNGRTCSATVGEL